MNNPISTVANEIATAYAQISGRSVTSVEEYLLLRNQALAELHSGFALQPQPMPISTPQPVIQQQPITIANPAPVPAVTIPAQPIPAKPSVPQMESGNNFLEAIKRIED